MNDDILEALQCGVPRYNEETRNYETLITKRERLAIAEIKRLRKENARLRKALKPFSDRLDGLEKSPLTKHACAAMVEIEHLRAARAAIREGGEDE